MAGEVPAAGASRAFDLVVVGSGPAGEKGAVQAAYFGKRVALVERDRALGGAGANTGTLPSKTLRETALYLSGFRQRGLYGIDAVLKRAATVRDFLHRERVVSAMERERIAKNLGRHGVQVYRGQASFIDSHTVAVRSESHAVRLQADFMLIATGSSPHHPSLFDFGDPRTFDSDTILELADIPTSLAVVGGGVIGCEYACTFAALGVEVTVIDAKSRLLPFLDAEMSTSLQRSMEKLGVRFVMDEKVQEVAGDGPEVVLNLQAQALSAGSVLVTSGRTGNTAGLNLQALGLKAGSRGHLGVNEHYQTSIPHVYAAGDVVGFPALASTSMEQGRIAIVHAFNLKYKTALPAILPYGIFTIPEVSMAGDTEETLHEKGVSFVVGRAAYAENARGQIIGGEGGLLKLLFSTPDMRLLGVHAIGEAASEIIHTGLTALLMEATADLFIQTCYNYPTLSEAYKYATYDAMGHLSASTGLRRRRG